MLATLMTTTRRARTRHGRWLEEAALGEGRVTTLTVRARLSLRTYACQDEMHVEDGAQLRQATRTLFQAFLRQVTLRMQMYKDDLLVRANPPFLAPLAVAPSHDAASSGLRRSEPGGVLAPASADAQGAHRRASADHAAQHGAAPRPVVPAAGRRGARRYVWPPRFSRTSRRIPPPEPDSPRCPSRFVA